MFSAPAADGAVLPDKGGHRHLVAAAGRGAHSFAGAWGQERREPGERGARQAVGRRPARVTAESRRPARIQLRARPDRVPRPAGRRGREGRVQLLFPRGPRREEQRLGRARHPGPGSPAQARVPDPGPGLHPAPFFKIQDHRWDPARWPRAPCPSLDPGTGALGAESRPRAWPGPKTPVPAPHPSLEPRTPAQDPRPGLEPRTPAPRRHSSDPALSPGPRRGPASRMRP